MKFQEVLESMCAQWNLMGDHVNGFGTISSNLLSISTLLFARCLLFSLLCLIHWFSLVKESLQFPMSKYYRKSEV